MTYKEQNRDLDGATELGTWLYVLALSVLVVCALFVCVVVTSFPPRDTAAWEAKVERTDPHNQPEPGWAFSFFSLRPGTIQEHRGLACENRGDVAYTVTFKPTERESGQ